LFFSNGDDLQPIPINLQPIPMYRQNLFVRDITTGVTQLVSVSATGDGGANRDIEERQAVISADGNVVAFSSRATNLHPLHTVDSGYNIFVRNLQTGVTQLATLNSTGTDGANGYCFSPALSSDGAIVAFLSGAKNLHPLKTTGGSYDAFARNLLTGEIQLASINTTATGGANDTVERLSISADGRIVVFDTRASNISTSDFDNYSDVFARDLAVGTTILVSDDTSAPGEIGYWNAQSSLSADGRVVAFESGGAILARRLATGDTTLVARGLCEVVDGASQSYRPSLSADGTVIAFWSEAADLVPRDWNQRNDVFAAELTTDMPDLTGDYNEDGIVNTADYTVWRNTLGQTGLTPYSGADGNGDGTIGPEDYGIWKLHFGETIPQGAGSGEQGVQVASALAEPVAHVAEDPHPLDHSRPLSATADLRPEGAAINAALAEPVVATLYDGTALLAANILTGRGSAGASPSRGRVASVVRDSPRDDALVAWLAESAGADRHRWNADFENIEDSTGGASGTEFDGGLRDRPLLGSFDAVFASVGGGV
jgi:Tol biopolymer transport system component